MIASKKHNLSFMVFNKCTNNFRDFHLISFMNESNELLAYVFKFSKRTWINFISIKRVLNIRHQSYPFQHTSFLLINFHLIADVKPIVSCMSNRRWIMIHESDLICLSSVGINVLLQKCLSRNCFHHIFNSRFKRQNFCRVILVWTIRIEE